MSFDLAGTYHLCVYMHPGRVQPLNSPLRVVVRPGPPCASRCRSLATVTECRMLAGERRAFGVRTFDAFGNACDVGGAALRLVGGANGGSRRDDRGRECTWPCRGLRGDRLP